MTMKSLSTGLAGALAAAAMAVPATTAPSLAAPLERTSPDLDVLFVGAHPDDEAGRLSTYGQWHEYDDVATGVVTITRGEGGGNAVGPEEGPALGLIREAEERRAVAQAGITDVYNLDQVDFYYTVSAPLTEEVWGREDTLERVVRVIRETRPEVIVTMDPAPSPGNHGNHQYAGRMAFEAYDAAGDPRAFRSQLTREGLRPFAPAKLFLQTSRTTAAPTGPACPTSFTPQRDTQNIYGVWGGRASEANGTTWAQVEREAQREYASQGWAVFPDVSTDPNALGCDFLTLVEARVPFTPGDRSAAAAAPTAALDGAVVRPGGGFPLGTGLEVEAESFTLVPGASTDLRITITAPRWRQLRRVRLDVVPPAGWDDPATVTVPRVRRGDSVTRSVALTAPDDAATNRRVLARVAMSSLQGSGYGDAELEVVPPLRGTQQLLPQVADFQAYALETGYPEMEGFVKPVLTLASGGSREVDVTLTNFSEEPQSGTVTPALPAGFSAEPAAASYADLAPGATGSVSFTVTNTDAALPTSNAGGVAGDYDYTLETTAGGVASTTSAALELVPTTEIPTPAAAPVVDGQIGDGEYAGHEIDLSRLWEGTACASAADCSATGHVAVSGDDLYVAVEVTDDVLGTVLDPSDCKRHWRTDSVEIAFDPDGTSENTSTTFKALVLPTTTDGTPCFGRDADNRQGPGAETAPGMEVASALTEPYTGYVVEAKIPAALLPATIDPEHLGMNVFVYDSDTQDKTGQTRLGWSTWGGVQGDPYRWGIATVPGWTPPAVPTAEPVIPSDVLLSADSPQTIAQAVRNGVPIAGGPAARRGTSARLVGARAGGSTVTARVDVDGRGEAHAFVVAPDGAVLGSVVTDLSRRDRRLDVPVSSEPPTGSRVLMAYLAEAGGSTSSGVPVR